MFLRFLIRSLIVLGLLGAAVPARAGAPTPLAASPFAADRASDGAIPGTTVPTSTQSSSSRLEGVDVSNWQGNIDWNKVAGAGKRFAFVKATEGVDYVDPFYSQNHDEALAAGLGLGAYHFARPDLHPSLQGAKNEADHFVDVANVGVGDVLPVLDLERGDNIAGSKLINWALTWLQEVKRRTGVKPRAVDVEHEQHAGDRRRRIPPVARTLVHAARHRRQPVPVGAGQELGGPWLDVLAIHGLRARTGHRGLHRPRSLQRNEPPEGQGAVGQGKDERCGDGEQQARRDLVRRGLFVGVRSRVDHRVHGDTAGGRRARTVERGVYGRLDLPGEGAGNPNGQGPVRVQAHHIADRARLRLGDELGRRDHV
jgi:hypothetical protein